MALLVVLETLSPLERTVFVRRRPRFKADPIARLVNANAGPAIVVTAGGRSVMSQDGPALRP
ncbi:hypothetical protein [Actinomadura montaniterrae]|uniref:Uncharacterized protein n=1 Tax=Actinomadura montaniterrae TaxID=1803903 RepID=A0A6L3W1E1_9ACTN|nr:hypothetical protein [Actinomadura montaniterrae]KAB2380126.1 hypothetical protein F9B16_18270 [Actinomadura montaniterrae]